MIRDASRQVSLDGDWRVVFDPENRGKREGWENRAAPPQGAVPIRVPSCWEQIRPGYDGVAWYWRTFESPPISAGWRAVLRFDAVNYLAEVWIDGEPVGHNEGGYTPFDLDLTRSLRTGGRHVLVVRVLDPPKEGALEGIVLKETPCWREYESYNFGGIWQSVRLLILPPAAIADCFVMPDDDLKGVTIDLTVYATVHDAQAKVGLAVADWDRPSRRLLERTEPIKLAAGAQQVRFHLPMAGPRCWSPDDPHLYLLSLRLEADGVADEAQTRFGLRRLALQDGRFVLNGAPIFIKGGFHEGLYPTTFAAPPGREFVEDEIRKAKAIGFNLLRFWQIPIHPLVLDVADEMGMMLCDEPPIEWMLQTERTAALCAEEVRKLVLRDRNRPSVVMWTILNEGGVVKSLRPVRQLASGEDLRDLPITKAVDGLCKLARRLDPTRLIIDESGGWAKVAWMYRPGSSEGEPLNDVHVYIPGPTSDGMAAPLRHYGEEDVSQGSRHLKAGVPVFVTEFGYGSIPHLAKAVADYEAHGDASGEDCVMQRNLLRLMEAAYAEHRMDRFFDSLDDLIAETQKTHGESNYVQATALRANPRVAGYVMHAFSAGGCILGAETYDLWKNEKTAVARAVAEFNRPRFLSVILSATAVEEGASIKAEVSLANEEDSAGRRPLWLRVEAVCGDVRLHDLSGVSTNRGVHGVWSGTLPLKGPGTFQVTFGVGEPERPLAVGRRTVHVLPPLPPTPRGAVHVASDTDGGGVRSALARMGVSCTGNPAGADWIIAVAREDADKTLPPLLELAARGKRLVVLPWTPLGLWRSQAPLLAAMKALGVQGSLQIARGHWAPVPHYAEAPGLLEGLPQDRLLGEVYADVLPHHCILPFQEGTLAACFSYKQQVPWIKPCDFWWGSTILAKRLGGGGAILSTFPLAAQAAQSPVARRLLLNLFRRPIGG